MDGRMEIAEFELRNVLKCAHDAKRKIKETLRLRTGEWKEKFKCIEPFVSICAVLKTNVTNIQFNQTSLIALHLNTRTEVRFHIPSSTVSVLMYIHHWGNTSENEQSQTERSPLCWASALWEWNNCFSNITSHCNEILAVADTEWQIMPRFNHACVCGWCVCVWGGGWGGSIGFCWKRVSLKSQHKSFSGPSN